ncbi:MAG: thioredoxin [Candidatus Neomarinimicrobiota bacterium]
MVQHLTKQEFLDKVFDYETSKEWNYRGNLPAIIDFYADWCGPCKVLSPVIEDLAVEYDGMVNFFKIDTEAEQELAAVFGIRSIPSMLFIPSDDKPQMATGALPKDQLRHVIKDVLKVAEPVKN